MFARPNGFNQRWGLLALLLALAGPAWADEDRSGLSHPQAASRAGFLLGDELRYPKLDLVRRSLADLIAIPANMPAWDSRDWGLFSAVTVGVVAMMIPFDRSADVWLQDFVHTQLGPWRLRVWTPVTELAVWGSVWGTIGVLQLTGRREVVSLLVESFVVAQLYQFAFKLSLGREGPMNGDGLGVIYGPQASLALFPAGTPSGHAASMFALLGAASAFYRQPALTTALVFFGLAFGATLIISDYHFVSDVVWGAAMGFAIGNWVVEHRAARVQPVVSLGEQKQLGVRVRF